MKIYPLPTKEQIEWAECELGVIIHYGMEVYNPHLYIQDYKCSKELLPAEIFNPKNADTDQWVQAAKTMGAQYAILVANHVTGFSLWPTKVNEYSIAKSPYLNGQADIVDSFIKSCRKYDIKPGLYYSTCCNGFYGINDNEEQDYFSDHYQAYVKDVEQQLIELWTSYGELFEIWFDGGVVPHDKGGPNIVPLLEKYQPKAICFQGPKEHKTNIRWVGNEAGQAPLNCWATNDINTCAFGGETEDRKIGLGYKNGKHWMPAESDMGNRSEEAFGFGWYYRDGEEHLVHTPEHLLQCYYASVGRNSNLLIGMSITPDGYFPDTKQFEEFGQLVRNIYKEPILSTGGKGNTFELNFDQEEKGCHLVIKEDIQYGERVRDYLVKGITENGETLLFKAEAIGHKRLIPVNQQLKGIKLLIQDSIDEPIIKEMTAFR